MEKTILFEGIKITKNKRDQSLLWLCFKDKEGKSFYWLPKWKEIELSFKSAVAIEIDNSLYFQRATGKTAHGNHLYDFWKLTMFCRRQMKPFLSRHFKERKTSLHEFFFGAKE